MGVISCNLNRWVVRAVKCSFNICHEWNNIEVWAIEALHCLKSWAAVERYFVVMTTFSSHTCRSVNGYETAVSSRYLLRQRRLTTCSTFMVRENEAFRLGLWLCILFCVNKALMFLIAKVTWHPRSWYISILYSINIRKIISIVNSDERMLLNSGCKMMPFRHASLSD